GYVTVNSGSNIDEVSYQISNVTAIINTVYYNVSTQGYGNVTAQMSGSGSVGSNSSVVISMMPTIVSSGGSVATYSLGASVSAGAIVVSNAILANNSRTAISQGGFGTAIGLNASVVAQLNTALGITV
ncbi:MAG: hypothetical protein ACHQX1_03660, partial [Candidatus Micrarchaeales archaeon]